MSAYHIEPAYQEVMSLIKTTWATFMPNGWNKELRDVQAQRMKWLQFLQAMASGEDNVTLDSPFVVIEFGAFLPTEELGYAGDNVGASLNILLFDSFDSIVLEITDVSAGPTVKLADTTLLYPGLRLYIRDQQNFATILTVDSATQITLDQTIATVPADTIMVFDFMEVLNHRGEQLKAAIAANTFSSFFTMEYFAVDASATNPAQLALSKSAVNHGLQGVSVFGMAYTGTMLE